MLDLLHINWVEEKFKIQSAFAQHQDVRDIKFNVFQGYQHAFDAAALLGTHTAQLWLKKDCMWIVKRNKKRAQNYEEHDEIK